MKYYLANIKKNFDKRSYFYVLSFMLLASTFLPVLFNNLPPIARSHHTWTPIWFISLLIFYPRIITNKIFQIFIIYGVFIILIFPNFVWITIDEWSKTQLIDEYYQIIVAVSIIVYYQLEQDYIRLAKLVKWSLVFIFITAIMSIFTSIIEPNYARDLVGISNVQSSTEVEKIFSYKKYGGGTYGFAGALICLFPVIMYYFKNNIRYGFKKYKIILFGSVLFTALLSIQLFANILITVFIIFLSIMGMKNLKLTALFSSFLITLLLIIPNYVYADFLKVASGWFPEKSEIHYKLNETKKYLIFGEQQRSAIGLRAERYPLLLNVFEDNVILGNFSLENPINIREGAHVHWMYKLGAYGLLGTVPFFLIFYAYIKFNLNNFDKEFSFYFLISVLSIFLLGLMKTLAGREMWYMVILIIPGLYYLPLVNRRNFMNIIMNKAAQMKSHEKQLFLLIFFLSLF